MEFFNGCNYNYVKLSHSQILMLSDDILKLPHEGICLVFGNFCFGLDMESIREIYDFENPILNFYFYMNLLCYNLKLADNEMISAVSMKKASRIAMQRYMDIEFYGNYAVKRRVMRKALIAAVICILSFSTALAASPQLREKIHAWLVERFDDCSMFELESENNARKLKIGMYEPAYVPNGFDLSQKVQQNALIMYRYEKSETETIHVIVGEAHNKTYVNTEGVELSWIKLQNIDACTFTKDDINYLIFDKDGYGIYLFGNVSGDELIKMANSI